MLVLFRSCWWEHSLDVLLARVLEGPSMIAAVVTKPPHPPPHRSESGFHGDSQGDLIMKLLLTL